jgi:glycosyltransferase involved in cell wall biosynthesis
MSVAVFIPCFNEAKTIEKVVLDFRRALPDAQIYVYDNNSTDETAEIAARAGAIVRKESRQGKGYVMQTGFKEIDADCLIMCDGDDTYPAENAAELAREVLSGVADIVIGDRLSANWTVKRKSHGFGNRLITFLVNRAYKSKVKDVMSGYRAMSRDFYKSFPCKSAEFEVEPELIMWGLANNFKITSVPIIYRDRPRGSFSKLKTIRDGIKVVNTILFRRPRRPCSRK